MIFDTIGFAVVALFSSIRLRRSERDGWRTQTKDKRNERNLIVWFWFYSPFRRSSSLLSSSSSKFSTSSSSFIAVNECVFRFSSHFVCAHFRLRLCLSCLLYECTRARSHPLLFLFAAQCLNALIVPSTVFNGLRLCNGKVWAWSMASLGLYDAAAIASSIFAMLFTRVAVFLVLQSVSIFLCSMLFSLSQSHFTYV